MGAGGTGAVSGGSKEAPGEDGSAGAADGANCAMGWFTPARNCAAAGSGNSAKTTSAAAHHAGRAPSLQPQPIMTGVFRPKSRRIQAAQTHRKSIRTAWS
jgi:hypothetical protein